MTKEMIIEAGKELVKSGKDRYYTNYGSEKQRQCANALMNNGYRTEAYLSLGLGQAREDDFVRALAWGGADYLAAVVRNSAVERLNSIWFD